MLTFEGSQIQGTTGIIEKLTVSALRLRPGIITDRPKNLVASLLQGAAQSDDPRRAAVLPKCLIAHRERYRFALGESKDSSCPTRI